ncbi:unnamed protein product [Parnassius mnemosyne]|uniref:UDP-glucuronosyltransferase n=1 Tax=Parnassius mnemosyne TaxID=213953 RepID=A0AAV1L3K5_9NEOP
MYNIVMRFTYIIIFNTFVIDVKTARILAVFPIPSISHQVVFRPLTLELAKRGHEVVVVTPDPAYPKGKAPANLTEINVHNVSYSNWKSFVSAATGKSDDLSIQMEVVFDLIIKIFEKQTEEKEFREILTDKRSFDLLLLEACTRPALSLSYLYKVPVILVSSFGGMFGNFETMGAPIHPILYPLSLRQKIYNLSSWEKLVEWYYNDYSLMQLFKNHEEKENKVLKRIFGPNIPTLSELTKNVQMLFLNVHPIWDNNRPVPPNVIYMGGLHQKPLKQLPTDLQILMDSSINGVIYFSLGTNVNPSLLPPEKIQIFVNVFSRLPYEVLWKWDSNALNDIPKNIKIMKWFPQSDLLRHEKVKLFITQGGLQSTDEAITAGVPLIGIPMLGDQWYNVGQYVRHGIGIKLDLETLTEEIFATAIRDVLINDSYRHNIKRLRSLMHDQPQSSLERAVWWTEHVLRHGGAEHLRGPAANLTWIEYYEVKLLLILLFSLCFIIGICFVILLYFVRVISTKALVNQKLKSN